MTLHPGWGSEEGSGPSTIRCEFGLCRRDAELEVALDAGVEPLLLCGLHVTPVLSWGVPNPLAEPRIRALLAPPETAA